MHTQLGSSGSSALGAAAAFRVQMRKGFMKDEPINVIAFCGDGGGADMGLGSDLGNHVPSRLQPADPDVRQRIVCQYRNPDFRDIAVWR
jgi:hypothetical protein